MTTWNTSSTGDDGTAWVGGNIHVTFGHGNHYQGRRPTPPPPVARHPGVQPGDIVLGSDDDKVVKETKQLEAGDGDTPTATIPAD